MYQVQIPEELEYLLTTFPNPVRDAPNLVTFQEVRAPSPSSLYLPLPSPQEAASLQLPST
jgi:hypothetical protein